MGIQRIWITVVGLLILTTASAASVGFDNYAISGVVVVKDKKTPISGAWVTVYTKYNQKINSQQTNAEGKYLMTLANPPQEYFIDYNHPDYVEEVTGLIANTENHLFGDLELAPVNFANEVPNAVVDQFTKDLIDVSKSGGGFLRAVARRNLEKLLKSFSPTSPEGMQTKARIETALQEMTQYPISEINPDSNYIQLPDRVLPSPKVTTPLPLIFKGIGKPPGR